MNRTTQFSSSGIIAAAMTVLLVTLCIALPATAEESPEARTQILTVEVQEMVCRSCVRRIEGALEDTGGVVDLTIDLPNRRADIEYIPADIDATDIVGIIDDLGYTVEKLNAS